MNLNRSSTIAAAAVLAALVAGCNTGSKDSGSTAQGGASLQSVEYGRLVDIYTYKRIDPARDDRRDTANRVPVLVERDVLIRPDIESQDLFDTFGNARLDSDYRFMPFDVKVGHEQVVILWDNAIPPEKASFEDALKRATSSLPFVPGSFRTQDTSKRPIPVVPRNAALRLNFDRDLGVPTEFFTANPSALQLLEFISPIDATRAETFRPVPARVLSRNNSLILDTSLIGAESNSGRNTDGLPPSRDSRTANIRVALPTVGVLSKLIEFAEDPVAEFNGIDSNGDAAVIRDFRSGNIKDGPVGSLSDVEPPMIVAHLKMGITAVDLKNRILTINKRNQAVAIRGRIPYVDGALDAATGLAMGPKDHPLVTPLRGGDVVLQEINTPAGRVTLQAEIVMNLDVGNSPRDPAFQGLGMSRVGAQGALDGGDDSFVRVKVNKILVLDSEGNEVPFRANTLPLGEDCEVRVHYYHNVPYAPAKTSLPLTAVSDDVLTASGFKRVQLFLNIDPEPPILDPNRQVNFGSLVDPKASVALHFTEPMNLETVEPMENYILTNDSIDDRTTQNGQSTEILDLIKYPKPISMAVVAAKLRDHSGDGTLLQLKPPLGLFHDQGSAEKYCHILLDSRAPADMAGNGVDIFDRSRKTEATDPPPAKSLSIGFELDATADSNHVGYRIIRFAAQDEDGTTLGSPDAYGQFQLLDGELRALPVTRFSAVADSQILQGITRFDRGECDIAGDGAAMPPRPAAIIAPLAGLPGLAYTCPSMYIPSWPVPLSFQPPGAQPGGGISEPHNQRGSRLQMTYLEDDFGFAYHDQTKYLLDIEQMHWAPFNDSDVRFDVFDRYTMRMAHSDWRPDLTFVADIGNLACLQDCFSGRSGLRPTFDDNLLVGTTYTTVVKDKVYEINPNDATRAPTGTKFVPYPQFTNTYTWRDPRLLTWDMRTDRAVGLGGAHQPTAPLALRDTTANISSPYVPNVIETDTPPSDLRNLAALHLSTEFVFDYGDFHGFRTRDHDPIALPLLIDFSVYPDGPANGGFAKGINQFHIALVGPCWSPLGPGGYYNGSALCGPPAFPFTIPYPETRAHATGGIDQITGNDILIDPDTAGVANGSVIKDIFWGDPIQGLWRAPGLDDHVHWAQADFVRRTSLVTYGFWDTLRPNAHDFEDLGNNGNNKLPPEIAWRGRTQVGGPDGIPNLTSFGFGVTDLVTLMDPPLSEQPIGTKVVVEWRGAKGFRNDDRILNMSADVPSDPTNITITSSTDLVKNRGNLLSPFYACEAYRYAMENAFEDDPNYQPTYMDDPNAFPTGPRIAAEGLTPYVTEDALDRIRQPNGLLPQFLNFRFVLENNLVADPPLSPGLKSFAVAYRVAKD